MSDLTRLLFSVPDPAAEAVANLLTEADGSGVEQRDRETLTKTAKAGTTEFLLWTPTADVDKRVAAVETLLKSLAELGTNIDPWTWRSEAADPETWIDAYKKFFKVNRVARYTVIKPSWETYEAQSTDLVIEIDPGQAFGTGLHASTRLVISAMERAARLGPAPTTVLDLGCGTGILSIVAAKLWPGSDVLAVDNDPVAAEVAGENIKRNGLASRIQVAHRSGAEVEGVFAMIVANMTYESLDTLRPVLLERLDDYGRLILSGLLTDQAAKLCLSYTHDLKLEAEYSEEDAGWRALTLRLRS